MLQLQLPIVQGVWLVPVEIFLLVSTVYFPRAIIIDRAGFTCEVSSSQQKVCSVQYVVRARLTPPQ